VVKISGACLVARQNIPRREVRRSPAGLVPVPVGGSRRARCGILRTGVAR
jgi:hypothetical protein